MNTIAILFLEYVVNFPLRADPSGTAHSFLTHETAWLPTFFPGSKWGMGFVIAILAVIVVFTFLWRSSSGYQQRMAGLGHLTLFTRNMSNGRGWVGVSAALFGFNHPIGVFFSGLFFGLADAFSIRLQSVTDLPPSLVQVLPYFATLLALILVALQDKIKKAITKRQNTAKFKQSKTTES